MRILVSVRCLFLLSIFIVGMLEARSARWKPERVLGSERLALEDIRHIDLPANPSKRLTAAVEDLVALWPADLEQLHGEPAPSKQSIVLIRDPAFALRGYGVAWRDGVGFSIRRDRSRVYLRAATDEALANGLYAICRELLGARWYWPGELGFEQVGEVADSFPERVWRERPAFVQRTLYPVGTDFGRRNGLNRVYSFNHNLARIFTKDVFEASPEAFAMIGGERQKPRGRAGTDAQPDFTNPKTVDLAAEAARAHFEENPDANSFSLSINDNSLFDEGLETQVIIKPINYFRGRPNYTDLVFGFMNQVATQVFRGQRTEDRGQRTEDRGQRTEDRGQKPEDGRQRTEDGGQEVENRGQVAMEGEACSDSSNIFSSWISKLTSGSCPLTSEASLPYLTALAYYSTEQSPSFKVHPRVMPVLTSDRAQWHDPEYRAQDKALIERWANSGAERIATWDYYFGAPYPYPRQFTQWIGESIQYLHESGVDVFFSQLPSIWGLDGPKSWLAAELLRDPGQDVEALLDEFYTNFFGPAAEPVRQFYEIAEQTRNEREGRANWIKFYKDEAGIELFDAATLEQMRACLDQAQELVQKDRYSARVKIVSDAFSYTEAYADYHRSRTNLIQLSLALMSGDQAGGVELARAFDNYQSAKASFLELSQRLAEEPMHGGFKTFNRLMQSEPVALALAALARSDFDLEPLDLGKGSALVPAIRDWQSGDARLVRSGKNPELTHSGSELRNFLGPEIPTMAGWEIQYRASDGLRMIPTEGETASGIRVENADIVSLSQTYPVLGEKIYLLEIEAGWQVSPDNRTRVQLNWESISGENLKTEIILRLPNGSSTSTQLLQFAFQAPANAYDLRVGIVTNRQYEGDFLEIKRVELGEFVPKR